MQDLLKKLLGGVNKEQLAFDSVQDKVITAPTPQFNPMESELGLDPLQQFTNEEQERKRQQEELRLFRDKDMLANDKFGSMANLNNLISSIKKPDTKEIPAQEMPESRVQEQTLEPEKQITPEPTPAQDLPVIPTTPSDTKDFDRALEYINAARSTADQKRRVAQLQALNSVTEGMIGTGGVSVKTGVNYDKLDELADAPLQELEVRDKGLATQQKLDSNAYALALEKESANPQSEMSMQARNNYAVTLAKLGREDLADKINNSNMSFAQLKSAYGGYNLANMESIYESAQNRLAQGQIKAAQQQEQMATKDQEKMEKRTADMRRELSSNRFGKLAGNYDLAKRVGDSIDGFMKRPTGYTDFGTLMMGVKTLQGDDSVVREAELRQAQQATSAINKAKNVLDSWKTGKSLQPQQRKDIAEAVRLMGQASKAAYIRGIAPVITQAQRNGIPLEEILDADLAAEVKKDPTLLLSYQDALKIKKESKVKVRTPQGKVVLVPYGQVNSAISAGGVVIDE